LPILAMLPFSSPAGTAIQNQRRTVARRVGHNRSPREASRQRLLREACHKLSAPNVKPVSVVNLEIAKEVAMTSSALFIRHTAKPGKRDEVKRCGKNSSETM